jgi:LPXTG-site transpeptidase (sortase) family protein
VSQTACKGKRNTKLRNGRTLLNAVSGLLIGLGLLTSLAAAGSAILDARQTASPFDQVDDNGSSAAFVPIIAPQAGSGGQGAAPTLPPQTIGLNGAALTAPPTTLPSSLAPTSQPVTGQSPAAASPLPTATLAPISIPDRIVIPGIKLDAPAVPAKLKDVEYQGKPYQQWVAPNSFAAGWLATSASLGVAGNTVLSGHNNLHGEVFGHLQDLRVGDLILVYSGERQFAYVIVLKMILPERFQPLAVRLTNARWLQPSGDERLTLVTCWPYESNTHRLIIVATPISENEIEIANVEVTPRLTPHPPLSWLSTPTLPASGATLEPVTTASP